ncbi:GSU2403 family nucleotidyltransferase fold protein [Massilia glaciei]|uniref:Nucleotidyltransferase-like domain-containing protein n=1 Tax=Massilia glaciei TaxID=1524097 RepID=A0A2U2I6U0_9BURK|nr:nucleotidyltransferase domain-containing protein [Massilia glaciei]PWF55415.1 hypothetical protein C7C56_001925 [Massilia glaciei]
MDTSYSITELEGGARRQYINARQVFLGLRQAEKEVKSFEGTMFWREVDGRGYLIRAARGGAQKGFGARSPDTELIFEKFHSRKNELEQRLANLREKMAQNVRLNKAMLLERVDKTIIDILNAITDSGLDQCLTVVGTNALYAYEAAAGVRIDDEHLATEDLDLLWDNRKRLTLATREKITPTGLLGLLKRVDKTFELLRPTQLYTAMNAAGYQIDIIRRLGPGSDREPAQLIENSEDFWAVSARNADWLLSAPKFEAVVVGTNGEMANMMTVDPRAFALFKVWMAQDRDREPLKKTRDANQAKVVVQLIQKYFPNLSFEDIKVFPTEVRHMIGRP